jgi:hypothetical protein
MRKKIFLTENQLRYIIKESLTDDVYHFTNMASLKNIVETNKMFLSNSFENSTDSIMSGIKYPYYLSLTRSFNDKFGYVGYMNKHKLNGDKSQALSSSLNVRIEFDGRMLNYNFKGSPVNYHWKENKRSKEQQALRQLYGDEWDNVKDFQLVQIRQDEDRLLSKKPYISNVNKYIKRIDVCINMDGFSTRLTTEFQNFLYSLLLNQNYQNKIFIYTNENDYNKRYRPINDKIISSNGNFANLFSSNKISSGDEYRRVYSKSKVVSNNKQNLGITPMKIKKVGMVARYIHIIDPSCNINNLFEIFKNSFQDKDKGNCDFDDETIISLLNDGYNQNITPKSIDTVLKFIKSDFSGKLRAVYSDITNELTKALSKHVGENSNSVNNYFEMNRQKEIQNMRKKIDKQNKERVKRGLPLLNYEDIERNNPTFRNMAKYFLK